MTKAKIVALLKRIRKSDSFTFRINKAIKEKETSIRKEIKEGDIVYTIENNNSHNYGIGNLVYITGSSSGYGFHGRKETGQVGNNLIAMDCVILSEIALNKEDILKEMDINTKVFNKRTKEHIALNKELLEKIKWMEELAIDIYDERKHKIWLTITAMENKKMNKKEKMEAILLIL